MPDETSEYTFHRKFTGDTLFNRKGMIIYNCRLYEIRDEAGTIVAKYYAGDVDSIIELPGKLYLVKDDTGLGNRKKIITDQSESGDLSCLLKLNFWNTTGTVYLNNEEYTFKQTKPGSPLLKPGAVEREYLLFNDEVKIQYKLSLLFPGTDGRIDASPADGIMIIHKKNLLPGLFGIVIIEMMIRGYELNAGTS